jgi:hypothetical protein
MEVIALIGVLVSSLKNHESNQLSRLISLDYCFCSLYRTVAVSESLRVWNACDKCNISHGRG